MAERHWGVFLCQCGGMLDVDAERIGDVAGLVTVANHPETGLEGFAQAVAREGLDNVLVGCCAAEEPFREALRGKVAPNRIHFVDLKQKCFQPHPDPGAAHAKALRMIRASIAAAEGAAEPRDNLLKVEGRVLVHTAGEEGLRLAELLADVGEVRVFLSPEAQKPAHGPLGKVKRGRLAAVEGRLGDFKVTIEPGREPDARPKKPRLYQVGQVVVVAAEPPAHLKLRTGVHLVKPGANGTLESAAQNVRGLVGLFRKPEPVRYDPAICAGGAAGMQACGRCVTACPYDAIRRGAANPLRVEVDQMTCEGCGACSSACPTSAISFNDPSPKELYARLAGLLAPLPPRAGAKGKGRKAREKVPLVVFHCGEMGERIFGEAARQGLTYPAAVLPVAVPCLRYVSEANLLAALRMGAAGVAMLGCDACPNGERELLASSIEFSGRVLSAFGLDKGRLRMITAEEGDEAAAVTALATFASSLNGIGVEPSGSAPRLTGNREMVAFAVAGLIEATGRQPGGIKVPAEMAFAFAEVDGDGCTLCRSCANVCPTHAFRFQVERQALEFKAVNCIGCRLCEQACPERVISVRPEFYLESGALDYMVVAEDEPVACPKCKKPHVSRRALENIEAKVFGLQALGDTFFGDRKKLLRMCPDCRAAYAMLEVDKGWQP
ncbi:MAG: 4Fe-4S binding protein [bacterium]